MKKNVGRSGAVVVVAAMVVMGCGGEPEPTAVETQETAGDEGLEGVDDGMGTSGTLGTIPQFAIESSLQGRQRRFLRCFTEAWKRNDLIGGEIRFVFRADAEGAVRWVYPASSSVGDHETERCLLEVARGATFPPPGSGEAEFTWSLSVDPMEDVRPPVAMEAGEMEDEISENAAAALEECAPDGSASYRVTAYVKPGGAVLAAGLATRAEAEALPGAEPPPEVAAEAVQCVVDHVEGWELPDPGSYPGKISFDLR